MNTLLRLIYRLLLIPYFIGSVIEHVGRFLAGSVMSVAMTVYKLIRDVYTSVMHWIVSTVDTIQKSLKKAQRRVRRGYKRFRKQYVLFRIYIRGQSVYFKIAVVAALLGAGAFFFTQYARTVPTVASYADFVRPSAVVITDRDGTTLYSRFAQKEPTPVASSDLPLSLIKATEIAEGGTFGEARHLAHTAFSNRKLTSLKEAVSAVFLMTRFSTRQIQEFYFTTTIYAGEVEGAKAAAATFFSKDLEELTPQEAIILAALSDCPMQPAPCDVTGRATRIASAMRLDAQAIAKSPLLKGHTAYYKRAPWAVDMILESLPKSHSDMVIRSTIDLSTQNQLQERVLEGQEEVPAVTIEDDGSISAIVGGKDYWAQKTISSQNLKDLIALEAQKAEVTPTLILQKSDTSILTEKDSSRGGDRYGR